MNIFLLILSFACLITGLVFVYKPAWLVRINRFVRERIFNDAVVLLDRRKKGFFFLLLFILFFFLGFDRLQRDPSAMSMRLVSVDRQLYESFRSLQLKEYKEAKEICEKIISHEPGNAEAYYQLGAAQFLLKDPISAKKSWAMGRNINPASDIADRLRKLIARQQNLPSEDIPALK